MNIQDFIVDSINQSTIRVFSTMLGVDLPLGAAAFEDSLPEANCEVVSLIGLAGAWAGLGSVNCSCAMACRVCASMLTTEVTSVNEEVLDAVAELTNIIIGNVKTELESRLGPLGLSIPTVVYGRNFRTKTASATDWIVLRFRWDDDYLTVKLCLAPHEKDTRYSTPLFEAPALLTA